MSDGLLLYDGGLLFVDGGLTADPNCCCYYEPATCPPCCIRIDWGTFDEAGDLVDDYVASGIPIAVKVVMPTKNSRIVCDTEQATVQWELDAAADEYGAWVRFGAAWLFIGESPLVEASGETYEWGLVDWVGTSSSTFEVTLSFRKCFLDSGQFLGFIVIGMDFPDWDLEIDITRCVTADYCCRPDVTCEDCCALLNLDNTIFHDGKHYIVVNSVDGDGQIWTGVLEIELVSTGKVCEGDGVSLDLFLVPPRHGDIENNTVLDFPYPWKLGVFSPAISVVDGLITPIKIDWGTLTATRYTAELTIECDDDVCDPVLTFPDISIRNDIFGFVGNVDFTDCDMEDCCCPTYCIGNCMFPLSDGACEGERATVDEVQDEAGGETQIVNFRIDITSPIPNDFCGITDEATVVQVGESIHEYQCVLVNGRLCARSLGQFRIPVNDSRLHDCTGNTADIDYWITIKYNGDIDKWEVTESSPSLGNPDEFIGDCEGATGSGTNPETDILFEWFFEVTGAIACPCGAE